MKIVWQCHRNRTDVDWQLLKYPVLRSALLVVDTFWFSSSFERAKEAKIFSFWSCLGLKSVK